MGALAVLGAGAWGTAISVALAPRYDVRLWARDAGHAHSIDRDRRNARYLPDISLPAAVSVTAEFGAAIQGAELLIVATPVAGLREVAQCLAAASSTSLLVWLCKGFEQGTGLLR